MPLYEYQCTQCGKRTEVLQKFDDAPLASCPACGGEVKKMVSSPAFQFKGSGWYVTDYAGKKGEGSSSKTDKDKSEASGESKSDAAANSTATSTPAGGSSEPAKSKEPAAAKASSD